MAEGGDETGASGSVGIRVGVGTSYGGVEVKVNRCDQ